MNPGSSSTTSGGSIQVVMYHYVREIKDSHFPGVKGLETSGFVRQLDFFDDSYRVLSYQELLEICQGKQAVDANSVFLTFDDGFCDHYRTVFPLLRERSIQAAFFPPSRSILFRELLDVHRVQFVLAVSDNHAQLLERLLALMGEYDSLTKFKPLMNGAVRFDSRETATIKALLQRELPQEIRAQICKALFRQLVSEDEYSFADELYMTREQLCEMNDAGMTIGSHTASHPWLEVLSESEQRVELMESLDFLSEIGVQKSTGIALAYPFGSFSQTTTRVAKELGFAAAFTTRVETLRPQDVDLLEIPRFDTNDFPQ